jgi:hypothetical protein
MSRNYSPSSALSKLAAIVYIWHDPQVYHGHGAVSSFYFIKKLDLDAFKERVEPRLGTISGVMPHDGVRHYPHHLTVQWSTHLHDDARHSFEETQALIEEAVVAVLAEEFGWDHAETVHLPSFQHVRDMAHLHKKDWRSNKL